MPAAPAASTTSRSAAAAACCTCLGAILAAAPIGDARAQERTLAIVELTRPPTLMGLGAQVEQQIESAARAEGFAPIPPRELEAKLGPDGWAQLRGCLGEVACAAPLLAGTGATHAVIGALDRDPKSYLLKLSLLDLGSGRVVASLDRAILIASRRFQNDVAQAIPPLLRGEGEARGALRVTSTVDGAEVWIDGRKAGATPLEIALEPGKYEVRVQKEHHLPMRRLVSVEANARADEEFRLLRAPGAPVASAGSSSSEVVARGGLRVRPPALVAIGVAAASVGAGITFGAAAQRAGQETLPGRQRTVAAQFLYGLAGVAGITAASLIVFESIGGAQIGAGGTVGPGFAAARLEGRF